MAPASPPGIIEICMGARQIPGEPRPHVNHGLPMGGTMILQRSIARFLGVAAVLICFLAVFTEPARAQVPTINIQETCRAAAGVMVNLMGGSTTENDIKICVETENKAHDQIVKDWSNFQASDRQGCIDTRAYLPSYVEWLTCFDMNKVVREARQQQGRSMQTITNPDGTTTMPSVCNLQINMGCRYSRY